MVILHETMKFIYKYIIKMVKSIIPVKSGIGLILHLQGYEFRYFTGYGCELLELHFQLCFAFLTLSNKVEKCLSIRFVCLSVCALTLVNIFQTSWNWYILFISDKAWTVLKMVYIRLMVCRQTYTNVFRCITTYEWKMFKAYFNIFRLH